MQPKIALLDIETAPNLGWFFDKYKENNIIETDQDWFILSFAYKWLDSKKITVCALPDFPCYKSDRTNDRALVKELWKVFDQADVLVTHNGDRFDLRKSNARFIAHGFDPPSPFKSSDTIKIARKHFKFDSNRLDDLGRYLGVGRKLPHTGKHLWLDVMAGDEKSWGIMRRYNARDVELLERVYLKLRPWSTSHPRLTDFTKLEACPTCQSPKIQSRGFAYTRTGKRTRFQCTNCGAWSQGQFSKG